MAFEAPVGEITFTMERIAGLAEARDSHAFDAPQPEELTAILSEAGRFAADRLAAIDRQGDVIGARLENGSVVTPPGWREAYGGWRDAGWNGVSAPEEFGGQGLPVIMQAALHEIWNASSA